MDVDSYCKLIIKPKDRLDIELTIELRHLPVFFNLLKLRKIERIIIEVFEK